MRWIPDSYFTWYVLSLTLDFGESHDGVQENGRRLTTPGMVDYHRSHQLIHCFKKKKLYIVKVNLLACVKRGNKSCFNLFALCEVILSLNSTFSLLCWILRIKLCPPVNKLRINYLIISNINIKKTPCDTKKLGHTHTQQMFKQITKSHTQINKL